MAEVSDRIADRDCDIFDSIVCAEERFEEDGFSTGFQDGKVRGRKTGFQKGISLGKQVADEIGFYQGFVLTWKKILESKDETNIRKMKAVKSLLSLLESFNVADPTKDDYMAKLNQIRSKFKQNSSLFGGKDSEHIFGMKR